MSTPPTMTRRNLWLTIQTHPFELALGAALAINGLRGFFGDVTASIDALPELPRFLYLAVSALGGVGVAAGLILNDPPSHIGLGKTLERASLWLVAASYGGLGILLVGNNGGASAATALVCFVVGAACVLRAIAIAKTARIILEALAAANRQTGGHP